MQQDCELQEILHYALLVDSNKGVAGRPPQGQFRLRKDGWFTATVILSSSHARAIDTLALASSRHEATLATAILGQGIDAALKHPIAAAQLKPIGTKLYQRNSRDEYQFAIAVTDALHKEILSLRKSDQSFFTSTDCQIVSALFRQSAEAVLTCT